MGRKTKIKILLSMFLTISVLFSGCVAPVGEKTELKQKVTRMAKENLSQILNVEAEEIKVIGIEEALWPDPSLGYGDPNESYLPVEVPGYKIFLQYNETIYEYHADDGRMGEPIVVPPPTDLIIDLSKIKIYPENGKYISSEGYNNKISILVEKGTTYVDSKILLLNYSLNYTTLKSEDICSPDAAKPGDFGIVIRGTIKNEYDRVYLIILRATAYDSNENLLGQGMHYGPICGLISRPVGSNTTENFELHFRYNNRISKLNLSGQISNIVLH